MKVKVKNIGKGLKVFKSMSNKDVRIQPGDSVSFDMHPHHVRIADSMSKKVKPDIELVIDEDDLATALLPGGNMTPEEKEAFNAKEDARLAAMYQVPAPAPAPARELAPEPEPEPEPDIAPAPVPAPAPARTGRRR